MFSEQAFAVLTEVTHADNSGACDTLVVPDVVHELGTLQPDFPDDELISSFVIDTDFGDQACSLFSPTSHILVRIKNESPFDFSDLWYVVDDGTSISNFDGVVDNPLDPEPDLNRTFKIDSVGINTPLIFEDITVNGIFESGETWHFIMDQYSGPGGLVDASKFGSVGVPSPISTATEDPVTSTGSIIALRIEKGGTVGGVFIGIDTTAILLAGAQMTSAWLVPIIVAAIGIGIVLARKF